MKHVILATDDNYAIPCIVTITSLLINNKQTEFAVHVLTQGLNKKNTNKFNELKQKFKTSEIELCYVGTEILKGVVLSERFPISNFYRLLIPSLFNFNEALYLDADIIINGNIGDLWKIDIDGFACAMVEDQACEDITLHNRIRVFTPYYNAGVLLMNLEYWRKNDVANKLLDFMRKYPHRCLYPDQDAINAVLAQNIKPLDYKFNVQERWYEPQDYWLMHYDKWGKIKKAKENPIIIHYTGPQKPWTSGCVHPLVSLYKKYQSIMNEHGDMVDVDHKSPIIEYKNIPAKHKHIRIRNRLIIVIVLETIMFALYILFS